LSSGANTTSNETSNTWAAVSTVLTPPKEDNPAGLKDTNIDLYTEIFSLNKQAIQRKIMHDRTRADYEKKLARYKEKLREAEEQATKACNEMHKFASALIEERRRNVELQKENDGYVRDIVQKKAANAGTGKIGGQKRSHETME
jgi:hypothetical protein